MIISKQILKTILDQLIFSIHRFYFQLGRYSKWDGIISYWLHFMVK